MGKVLPYYESAGVTLYCAEFEKVMPQLKPVDAIVTDPPYEETSCDWDCWPSGWPQLVRPLSRSLWCFGSVRMFMEKRDEFTGWVMSQDIVWEKHNGSSMHVDRFRRVHELALHFYQGEWKSVFKEPPIINIQEDRNRGNIKKNNRPAHWGGMKSEVGYTYDGTRIERSVIFSKSCHGYAVNETQKPLGIVLPLLAYSVPPGGVVLDIFAGSGATLEAARRQGKHAIGIEKRESQCAEIVKRLEQELPLCESSITPSPRPSLLSDGVEGELLPLSMGVSQ